MAIGNFLTTGEVATRLGVTAGRVHQFITDGRLKPAQKVGTILIFDVADVDKLAKIPRPTGRPPAKRKNTR